MSQEKPLPRADATSLATRLQVVEAARRFLGTPFHHQGRTPGLGLDCAGLLLATAAALGLPQQDYPRRDYSRWPLLGRHLYNFVAEQTREIDRSDVRVGSIMMFWIHRPELPQHLSIFTGDDRMIHAWSEAKAVVETYLGPYWGSRVYAAFDFAGVV